MEDNNENGNGAGNVHLDEERINAQFEENQTEAEETLKDDAKTRNILAGVLEKMKHTASKSIEQIKEDILLLIAVVSAYVTGRYKKIPFKTLAMILGALTYFLSPIDAIIDWVPVIGFLDDVFVIGMVLKFAHDDLQAFKAWETEQAEKGAAGPVLA